MEESVSDQGIGPYLVFAAYLAVCAVGLATGLLMLIAPRRVPHLPFMDALVPEEKLRDSSYRLEMRFGGALMAVMFAYMICRPFMWCQVSPTNLRVRRCFGADGGFMEVYGYLNAFVSHVVFPAFVFYYVVWNGIHMFLDPDRWISSSRIARRYKRDTPDAATPRQLRLFGLVFMLGGAAILVAMVRSWFR